MTSPAPMREQGVRHRVWPVLLAAGIGLAILLALGTWQVKRLAWKTDLIAKAEERLALPAIPLPSDPDTDWAALDFRRAEVSGRDPSRYRRRAWRGCVASGGSDRFQPERSPSG